MKPLSISTMKKINHLWDIDMAELKLNNIKKVYEKDVVAVQDFNLEIDDKEFVVFVGPSGCGKSTTLRMIAGLEEITDGEFYIDDTLMNDIAPKDRDIARSEERRVGKEGG